LAQKLRTGYLLRLFRKIIGITDLVEKMVTDKIWAFHSRNNMAKSRLWDQKKT
jgi:hypothetical protein